MNQEEVGQFINPWMKDYCMKQKIGFLYGYYAMDFNYPDGVRAVVETIYEPPQIGDSSSVETLVDKDEVAVSRIIDGLRFELLGV